MKKTVKGLIIAASVAAVVGVGAVSFAKWEVTSDNDVNLTGTTGVINTLGDLTVTPADDTYTTSDGAIVMNALYPVDQGGSYLTYWTFTLSSETTGTQSVSYKLAGTIAEGSDTQSTEVTAAALYWTKTTPTAATKAEDGTAVAAALTDSGAALGSTVGNGDTIYVYMIASGTDAMKANITLNFEQA